MEPRKLLLVQTMLQIWLETERKQQKPVDTNTITGINFVSTIMCAPEIFPGD